MLITGGMLPFQQDYDLCDTLKDYNLNSCPIKSGPLDLGLKMNIPGYVPAVSLIYMYCSVSDHNN